MTNPLLADWNTPFRNRPVRSGHGRGFRTGLRCRAGRGAGGYHRDCRRNPQRPTFANTIEALETAGKALDKVLSVFFSLAGADSNPETPGIAARFQPETGGLFSSEVHGNKALFARIDTLWQARDTLDLTPEQSRGCST